MLDDNWCERVISFWTAWVMMICGPSVWYLSAPVYDDYWDVSVLALRWASWVVGCVWNNFLGCLCELWFSANNESKTPAMHFWSSLTSCSGPVHPAKLKKDHTSHTLRANRDSAPTVHYRETFIEPVEPDSKPSKDSTVTGCATSHQHH